MHLPDQSYHIASMEIGEASGTLMPVIVSSSDNSSNNELRYCEFVLDDDQQMPMSLQLKMIIADDQSALTYSYDLFRK